MQRRGREEGEVGVVNSIDSRLGMHIVMVTLLVLPPVVVVVPYFSFQRR